MPAGQRGNVTRASHELGSIVHSNCQTSAHVVLEMRRLATVGPSDGLHVIGPPPTGLEDEPTDLTVANFDDLGATIGKCAGFIWRLNVRCSVACMRSAL